jgi:hypothetical protein
MYSIGQSVMVRPPFKQEFSSIYSVTGIVNNPDDTTVYILGNCGGFDAYYLENV